MAVVFINVAIPYQTWNLESWVWYKCISTWIAISNSSNILHLTLMWPSQPPFNKMAHVKSNCLHICKQFIWRDVIWTVLSKYTYVGVAILNILLFDLDRHFHSPFSNMVALKANVAISCEIYHLESISKLHVQRKWCWLCHGIWCRQCISHYDNYKVKT